MTKGTAFGIAMAAVGGIIALCSAAPKCEAVETRLVDVDIIKCSKTPGHFRYDDEGRSLGYVDDAYNVTVMYEGNRYVVSMCGPWQPGTKAKAYMDVKTYSNGSTGYSIVSLVNGE